jgi:hypothetical protein
MMSGDKKDPAIAGSLIKPPPVVTPAIVFFEILSFVYRSFDYYVCNLRRGEIRGNA